MRTQSLDSWVTCGLLKILRLFVSKLPSLYRLLSHYLGPAIEQDRQNYFTAFRYRYPKFFDREIVSESDHELETSRGTWHYCRTT